MKLLLALFGLISSVLAAAAEPRCGRMAMTARSLKISGTKFAPFERYSVGNIERVPCATMPKRTNVPAALREVTRASGKKGVWMLDGRITFDVDRHDRHIYRWASLVYYSTAPDLAVPERNAGEPRVAKTFPPSTLPAEERQMLAANPTMYNKRVLRIAVTKPWQAKRMPQGFDADVLEAAVGLLDPAGNTCTLWEPMVFFRRKGSTEIEQGTSSATVSEIACTSLR